MIVFVILALLILAVLVIGLLPWITWLRQWWEIRKLPEVGGKEVKTIR